MRKKKADDDARVELEDAPEVEEHPRDARERERALERIDRLIEAGSPAADEAMADYEIRWGCAQEGPENL